MKSKVKKSPYRETLIEGKGEYVLIDMAAWWALEIPRYKKIKRKIRGKFVRIILEEVL